MEKNTPAVQPASPSSEKFRITWDNINATVTLPSPSFITKIRKQGQKIVRKRQILFDVSGEAYSNSMLAIMGESGSGKTTLLNILAGTYSNKIKVNGNILLNGRNVNITSFSAYVEQMDLFIPTLTVREHLQFYAKLLLGSHFSYKEIEKKVNNLISDFGLEKCKNSQIGSPVRPGISGGECRRLSIASQVISKPKIIFLDEPTCGLDSFTAETVINILKKLSMNNCAIISTIHQPSSQLFNSFDRLILLAEGKIVYSGPRDQAIGLFQKAGFECPINYNPSDFFIEVLAIKSGREEECRTQITKLIDENAKMIKDRRSQNENLEDNTIIFDNKIIAREKISLIKQLPILLKRSWKSTVREAILFRTRVMQTIIVGLIFGLIYLKLPYNTENIFNFAGAIFGIISNTSFGTAMGVIFVIPAELAVFRREHRKRLYDTSMYYLSKTLVDIPVFILTPSLLVFITYFMVGFNLSVKAFITFWFITILIGQSAASYGYLISAMSKNFAMATALTTPLLIPLMIFGGFMIRALNIPVYFLPLQYISWFKYGFEAMCFAHFDDITLKCNKAEFCPTIGSSMNGSVALSILGLQNNGLLINVISLLILTAGFRILGLIALVIRTHLNER